MPKITTVEFGNGEIRFVAKVDPVPASSKTTGNVTVNNSAQPGSPAHYRTSFMLSTDLEEEGVIASNVFHWNSVVLNDDQNASYRAIEDQAVRQIAPLLRAVADEMDKAVAEFDAREAAKTKT